jgi:hypothetical protein
VLFVEKEGFAPILEAAQIAERFDIAIMSSKGMSVTAARQLVDGLAARGVRLFVLHDFDIAGFSIKKTLTESGRRHEFQNELDYVDLGVRLIDVDRLGLESEPVEIDKNHDALGKRLRINGATEAEITFLLSGRRVEINAMPSDVFIGFIEDKLREAGVRKVVPSTSMLSQAYIAFARGKKAQAALQGELERLRRSEIEVPDNLEQRVAAALDDDPALPWHAALRDIVDEEQSE